MVTNLYENVDAKGVTVRITVGGVLLTSWISAEWTFAFNRPPTATIVIPNPPPGVVTFEADVIIDTGFNGLTERCFTGTVLNVDPSERNCRVECQGKSKVLENTFQRVLVTVDGSDTAEELVEELLADSGLTDYEVNLPAWTPGTVCEHTLEFETFSEAILKVAEVDGGRWYELPTGTVRVEASDPIPSLTSWRTYFSGVLVGMTETYPPGVASGRPRLRHVSAAQKARDVKNRADVRGCTYTQTNPDGTKVSIDVEGDAMAASPWVLKPDGSQAYSTVLFPNELIDTPVKAGTVAARLVTLYNRLLTEITAEVDGDPQVFLGGTVRVEDPAYTGTTGNWFTESYTTRVTDDAFVTMLTLLGGPESGYTVNICPFALFTYLVDRQVMGDRLWAIIGLDATGSVDPDGDIVSYCWEDNQDPMLISGCSSDPYWTERVDPTDVTGTWLVTLTVTDDQGCEDDITLPVSIAEGSSLVHVPALWVAFDTWFSASKDGGVTWNDWPGPTGVSIISVSPKPYDGVTAGVALYGTSGVDGGQLWRTDDYCETALELVLSGIASPFEHVWWDLNHPTDVWALSQAGQLWRSQADGVLGSWGLYKDLTTLPWLSPGETVRGSRIATPAPEGVWVFGGQYIDWAGAGCLVGWPLICWDALLDGSWAQAAVGGELLEDLIAYGGAPGCTGVAGGPLDLYVREAASREAEELSIIFNSATWLTGVYYTPAIFGDGSGWGRCLELPDKSRGRSIAPDLVPGKVVFAFDDEVNYRGDVDPVTQIMTASVAPAALDTGPSGIDEPNHGIWIGAFNWWMPGVYLVAAEGPNMDGIVYKSWDRFESIDKLRPAVGFPAAPAGAKAKMVALSEPMRPTSGPLAVLCAGQVIYNFNGVDHWTPQADGPETSDYRLSQTRDGHWLFIAVRGQFGDMWHSPDGVNFTETFPHITANGDSTGVHDYDIGPDGTVWIVISNPTASVGGNATKPLRIYKSTNGGATWTLVYTDAGFDYSGAGRNTSAYLIAAHQQNPDVVVVSCEGRFNAEPDSIYTEDGGLTWTRRINPAQDFPRGAGLLDDMRFAASGRLMFLHSQTVCSVWYSDDLGETWTQATEVTAFNSPVGRQIGWWRSEWFLRNVMICDRPVAAPNSQNVKVFISHDNGATWDIVDADDPTFEYIAWSLDYDAGRDRLVVCHHYSGNPKVGAIDTPFIAPVKSDITADLPIDEQPDQRALAYPR